MSDSIIEVESLGKSYLIGHQGPRESYTALRDVMARQVRGVWNATRRAMRGQTAVAGDQIEEFWALRDVSFSVTQGEVVGIIGRNGAGKSTLLKILSRITEPTEGRVTLRGRVASLLEVGTGFHPELTGRENIYLNGAILGMTRAEIKRKFDEIVAFAEVERFLDTPVKRYSSGMYVRLAFAVAAHLEPEILVVDEVLAVGDAEFQRKCLGKMQDVAKGGRTVLFVSHQLNSITSLCHSAIVLDRGAVRFRGSPDDACNRYLCEAAALSSWERDDGASINDSAFLATSLEVVDADLKPTTRPLGKNSPVGIVIEGIVESPDPLLTIGYALSTQSGDLLWWSLQTDGPPDQWPQLRKGLNRLICWIPPHMLNAGRYRCDLIASLHFHRWIYRPFANSPCVQFEIAGHLSDSPYWREPRPGVLGPILEFVNVQAPGSHCATTEGRNALV